MYPAQVTRKEMLALAASVLAQAMLPGCTERRSSSAGGPVTNSALPTATSARRTMVQILEEMARSANPLQNEFLNSSRASLIRAHLDHPANVQEVVMLAPRLPIELLNAGQTHEAIRAYSEIEALLDRVAPGMLRRKDNEVGLRSHLALAYLRLGEQENCCAAHNADSCLLPLHGGGIYAKKYGSREAAARFLRLLEKYPDELACRWLYNIALMTLGEYPQRAPARLLIPPSAFASDEPFRHFPDVAGSCGLSLEGRSGGVILDDFDNDGYLDLMISGVGVRDQLLYFHNNGDGTFTERTREAGLIGELGGLNLISGDYNNDGFLDVVVLRGGWLGSGGRQPLSLLRNNGDGTFTDVTIEAGLLRYHPTQTAIFFDYNNDGLLDLFVGCESSGDEVHPCELFRNNGDGTFTNVARESGIDIKGYVKAVVSADFNNDGRPDLYLALRDRRGILLRNDGPTGPDRSPHAPWRFTDVTEEAGITGPNAGFAAFFFDYDNDGWPDLYAGGYNIDSVGEVAADYLKLPNKGERPRLYRNNRNGTFTDVTREANLWHVMPGMAANFGDLDNDGFLDFYLGTGIPNLMGLMPNRMFRNRGDGTFADITSAGGFGNLQKGHGIAFGDINNDGAQEVFERMGGAYEGDTAHCTLFANPGNDHLWVMLKLEGVKTNRGAIGVRVKVIVRNPDGREREIHRIVGPGGNFGCNPLRLEIGLGEAKEIVRVEAFWPATGKTQVWTGIQVRRLYHLTEGAPNAGLLPLQSFKLLNSKIA